MMPVHRGYKIRTLLRMSSLNLGGLNKMSNITSSGSVDDPSVKGADLNGSGRVFISMVRLSSGLFRLNLTVLDSLSHVFFLFFHRVQVSFLPVCIRLTTEGSL